MRHTLNNEFQEKSTSQEALSFIQHWCNGIESLKTKGISEPEDNAADDPDCELSSEEDSGEDLFCNLLQHLIKGQYRKCPQEMRGCGNMEMVT